MSAKNRAALWDEFGQVKISTPLEAWEEGRDGVANYGLVALGSVTLLAFLIGCPIVKFSQMTSKIRQNFEVIVAETAPGMIFLQ